MENSKKSRKKGYLQYAEGTILLQVLIFFNRFCTSYILFNVAELNRCVYSRLCLTLIGIDKLNELQALSQNEYTVCKCITKEFSTN